MAAKRTSRTREARLAFESLSIEGGLLSPEWLSKVAQLQAGSQAEADYRIHKGLNLRDEIGRYWRIAQAHWADFKAGREGKADAKAIAQRLVVSLLRDALGFASLVEVQAAVLGGRSYPVDHAALGGLVPVVVAPQGSGLDTLATAFGDAGRRRSAFGLAQEYLNVQDGALWGIASDGATLRIVRDNASLTRPAWIQVDLERIFTEERYADFAAFWLLCHETRFGREGLLGTECALEVWRAAGREEGTRAREHLRRGVEDALVTLGQGFLSHAENAALRADLQSGTLPVKDYFNQLLRLVYRLIFLLTVEERGLLHPEATSEATRALYAAGYGTRRLRERSVKRSAHDRFSDLWEGTKVVCRGLATGEARLGLPALAGVFALNQCPALDAAKLENRALLLAVFKLAWLREDGRLSRVNWRDMGPEELGSVYESLLELVPKIAQNGRQFSFATGGETKGNSRKTTGSYYTPDNLVQVLLDNALEPVIADTIAKNPDNTVQALLGLTIIDPACGSGHFLLAAARRLAAHVARLQANGTPSAAEYRHALRQVVGRCIFGVDLNPMAVELCKVALWMEAVEPGLPLTFLNSHIQHGNALLGTTPELMAGGIPDAAWSPIDGDDRGVASALKQRNKAEAAGQRTLDFSKPVDGHSETGIVTRAITELDATTDASAEDLAAKEERWDDILGSPEYRHQKFVADAWCAAFMWPNLPGELADAAPTNELWRQLRDAQGNAPALTTKTVEELSGQYRFFHWHLQFPQVFAKGGFDVALGNPPWDTLSPDAKEFFSVYEPAIRFQSKGEQEKTIGRLLKDVGVASAWESNRRHIFASAFFLKESGRFSLFAPGNLGKGDFNLYRLFVEQALRLVRPRGFAAQVVPDGLYSGANSMAIRRELFEAFRLDILYGFENAKEVWFPGVDSRAKFSLYAAQKGRATEVFSAAFWIRSIETLARVRGGESLTLPVSMVREFSPDALAVMEFRGQRDIDIARKMYARFPPLGQVVAGTAHRSYLRELESGHVQELLTEDRSALPHYEGRMIGQYDHRAKGYRSGRARSALWEDLPFSSPQKSIQPQWYVHAEGVPEQTKLRIGEYRVGFCDVASPTNERTLVAAMLPRDCVSGAKVPTITMQGDDPRFHLLVWLAAANSFVMDFLVRMKVSLTMALTILDSLPFPRLASNDASARRLVERALRLTCTGPEMGGLWDEFARASIVPSRKADQVPGALDEEQRIRLRAEIEAELAGLYGLSKDELEYVLDSFPIVQKDDEKAYGEFRTKALVLDRFDELSRPGGAKVIPLPVTPAMQPQPAIAPAAAVVPDLAAVAASAWTRPHTLERGEISSAIIAVLKTNGAPMDRRQARLASLLCLEPHLLTPILDKTEKAQWARVVGTDAENSANASIDATAREWGAALAGLRGRGRLVENLQQNTWALGTETEVIGTSGWPDGRAGFVVGVLRRLQTSADVDAIILTLPANAQGLVNAA
ncbi:MAG: N-6 DNA methylase [Vicinamibacterales bacterium]